MAAKTLVDKLKLKPGSRAALLNAPHGTISMLGNLPKGVLLQTSLGGDFEWVLLFVRSRQELVDYFSKAAASLTKDGVLWAAFPKGSSGMQIDLTRDHGWDLTDETDLKWAILISLDENWSAFGFRRYQPGERHESPMRRRSPEKPVD